MPRAGLDTAVVIERAAEMIDAQPANALSLAAVAESLGVRIPSLYKHVDGLPGLRRGIMIRAKKDLALTLGRSAIGRSRDEAISGVAHEYRRWALEHPGQYPMTVRAPDLSDVEDVEASSRIAEVVYSILAGYDLRDDDAVDATRFLRSAMHGYVSLETGRAFELPVDLERSYGRLVDSVVTALQNWARS